MSDTMTEPAQNVSYYQLNKQKIQEQYATKREDKLAYQMEYNLINRDKYLDYQKTYYESKKEEILRTKREKVTCECGKSISMGHMTTHKKTNIHLKRLAKLPVPELVEAKV
jgi:ribosomal protein S27AE